MSRRRKGSCRLSRDGERKARASSSAEKPLAHRICATARGTPSAPASSAIREESEQGNNQRAGRVKPHCTTCRTHAFVVQRVRQARRSVLRIEAAEAVVSVG